MAGKPAKEVKTKKAVCHTVYCGGQPIRTVYDDKDLAESLAREKKRELMTGGNDLALPEHTVEVFSEDVQIPA